MGLGPELDVDSDASPVRPPACCRPTRRSVLRRRCRWHRHGSRRHLGGRRLLRRSHRTRGGFDRVRQPPPAVKSRSEQRGSASTRAPSASVLGSATLSRARPTRSMPWPSPGSAPRTAPGRRSGWPSAAAAYLRALLDYGEDLIEERSPLSNPAHAELGGLHPGYQHYIPIQRRSQTEPCAPGVWALAHARHVGRLSYGRRCAG